MIANLIEQLELHCLAAVPVGSRVTCNPPPKDTDCDILCLSETALAAVDFYDWLETTGWTEDDNYAMDDFVSWKKEFEGTVYNVIATHHEEWFDKFLDATVVCKRDNVLDKAERVAIFNSIMYPKPKKKKLQFVSSFGMAAALPQSLQAQQAMNAMAAQQNFNNYWNVNPFAEVPAGPGGPCIIDDFVGAAMNPEAGEF